MREGAGMSGLLWRIGVADRALVFDVPLFIAIAGRFWNDLSQKLPAKRASIGPCQTHATEGVAIDRHVSFRSLTAM